jgi:hypothetical protein
MRFLKTFIEAGAQYTPSLEKPVLVCAQVIRTAYISRLFIYYQNYRFRGFTTSKIHGARRITLKLKMTS